MIFLGILLSMVAIGFLCWLLFTLAVFALPFLAGVTAGTWAYHIGAGWVGAILVGIVAAGLTLGIGQILLGIVRPLWARLLIALVFVAPAVIAGYHATHGIVKHTMPSETWQVAFSIIGAIAVGVTACVRVAGMAAARPPGPEHDAGLTASPPNGGIGMAIPIRPRRHPTGTSAMNLGTRSNR